MKKKQLEKLQKASEEKLDDSNNNQRKASSKVPKIPFEGIFKTVKY